jgi:hypothetical protein
VSRRPTESTASDLAHAQERRIHGGRRYKRTPTAADNSAPDGEHGPAMMALIPRHRECVLELFRTKGNRSQALKNCGYCVGSSDHNLWAQASRFFGRADVKAAMREVCNAWVDSAEPGVIAAVEELLHSEKVKPGDKLKAAALLWDRSNPVTIRSEMSVEHRVDDRYADTLAHLRYLLSLRTPHEGLVSAFGFSGLGRYMKMIEEQDRRDGKVIEATVAEGTE